MKILIIDDDELIRMTCGNILQAKGYTVLEAESGKKGVPLYEKEKPDLVLTDMLMPDKEGLETITEIRSINPGAKIIAMSGGGSTKNMGFLQLAEKFGATYTLTKPLKAAELIDTVKKALDTK